MKRILFVFFALQLFCSYAQIPDGYYNAAQNKTGKDLMEALYNTIKGHTEISYTGLWSAFYETDAREDGKVWDMYSSCNFTFGDDQDTGSGGTTECDVYNREHSFPRSWFGGAVAPMNTDLFHLYPTDKKVNAVRADYPYGNVVSASYTSSNGSKLGSSAVNGYSGTVFEPADDYKGDFARSYFYMVTRYFNLAMGWSCEMLNSTQHPAFTSWALNVLLEWHQADPVSLKEIERNNVVYYNYQNNRNPFIDHPNLVQKTWVQGSVPVEFVSTPVTSINLGNQYHYTITTSQTAGGSVTISALKKPSWLSLSGQSGNQVVLSGEPSAADIGNHYVVILANDGQSHAVQQFVVEVKQAGTSAVIVAQKPDIIYPNPTRGTLNIKISSPEPGVITIFNALGSRIHTLPFGKSSSLVTVDVSTLQPGVYAVTVDQKGIIHKSMLVVE